MSRAERIAFKRAQNQATEHLFRFGGWRRLYYRGVRIGKMPLDLWALGSLIFDVCPALIVEFGSAKGGSAYWMADWMDLHQQFYPELADTRILSVDLVRRNRPEHPRIEWHTGNSMHPEVQAHVRARASACAGKPILLIEDSCHRKSHVLAELNTYCDLVTPGSYFVVEDTVLDSLINKRRPGPHAAVQEFLAAHPEFAADRRREQFGVSFHAGGWLRRQR